MTSELETMYGFAAQLSKLTDMELARRFNAEVCNRGWGHARAYFTHCLCVELDRRSFDASCIVSSDGLRMNRKAMLKERKIILQV